MRKYFGLKTNDKVAFVIEPASDVKVKVPKYPTIASLRGAAGALPKPMSWREMKAVAMEERFKSKYLR